MKVVEQPKKPYGRRQWLYDQSFRCANCEALISITPEDVEQGLVRYKNQAPDDQRGNDSAECKCPCCGEQMYGIYPGGGVRRTP